MKKLFNWLFYRNKAHWTIVVDGKFIYGNFTYKKAKRLAHEMELSEVVYKKIMPCRID